MVACALLLKLSPDCCWPGSGRVAPQAVTAVGQLPCRGHPVGLSTLVGLWRVRLLLIPVTYQLSSSNNESCKCIKGMGVLSSLYEN